MTQLHNERYAARLVEVDARQRQAVAENTTKNAIVHLSSIPFMFIVFFPLLGPILAGIFLNRDDNPRTSAHIKEALNFHISMFLIMLVFVPFAMNGYFSLISIPSLTNNATPDLHTWVVFSMIVVPIFALILLVLPFIAAMMASRGRFFRYPMTVRFLK